MADDRSAGVHGHEGQSGDPPWIGAQCVDEGHFHRLPAVRGGEGERRAVDVVEGVDVVRELPADQHGSSMPGVTRRQR